MLYCYPVICLLLLLSLLISGSTNDYEGKVVKGVKNSLFLVQNGKRRIFPDFYTYAKMGFDTATIAKLTDPQLNEIPLGSPITPIPVFRPEDRMYHSQCEDPDRMVITVVIA
jgi:hypothetical protein